MLPRDSLMCLRLPYLYSAPANGASMAEGGGGCLLTRATAAEPSRAREAALLPGWLQMSDCGTAVRGQES